MLAVAYLLAGPPMPHRPKVMTQTKRDTLVPQGGGLGGEGNDPTPVKNFHILRSLIIDAGLIIMVKDLGKVKEDCHLYIATWNVLSVYTAGSLKQVKVNRREGEE
jgi:hypothetical protein